jgi:hypothetical protein
LGLALPGFKLPQVTPTPELEVLGESGNCGAYAPGADEFNGGVLDGLADGNAVEDDSGDSDEGAAADGPAPELRPQL